MNFCVFLLLSVSLFAVFATKVSVEVDTPLGKVRGFRGSGLNSFKGIPFAEPPQRWAPPMKKQPWAPNTLDATKYGARCPQNRPGTHSEDCLFLNILTPLNATNAPVMIFIHGGAFDVGIATARHTLGDFMTNMTNTIHVSINYRLGALGFLDGIGQRGNFGIMDQKMAIQWVYDNIKYFGGDLNQITLTGHSAGCMSIIVHMVMKNPPPFNRVILKGVPFGVQYRRHSANEIYSTMFARNLGCDLSNRPCFMNKTLTQILRAQQHTVMVPHPPLLNTRNVLPWTPTIDGEFLSDQPMRLLQQGKFKKVPVMMGVTRDEAAGFIYGAVTFPLAPWLYTSIISAWLLLFTPQYLRNYPTIHSDARNTVVHGGGDYYFNCANRVAAAAMSNHTDVYFYTFMHPPRQDPPFSHIPSCQSSNYSCHGAELTSIYKTWSFYNIQRTPQEEKMSHVIMNYVASFVHGKALDMPKYDPKTDKMMAFDLETRIVANYNKRKCDFWETIGEYFAR